MGSEKKNLPESVYSRLKNVAVRKQRPTKEILRYYAMERFLYRLSISQYKKSFFLKGGLMLMVWDPGTHRATLDIDLLARTNNSDENIQLRPSFSNQLNKNPSYSVLNQPSRN